jgi:hypothetical protein
MRIFTVMKEFYLGYGSHTRQLTPSTYKMQSVGTRLSLDGEAPNGNVWFIDQNGDRGKIECGEVKNLVADGRVVEDFI